MMKKVCVCSGQFRRILGNIKKVVCIRCCWLPFYVFWYFINHISNVIDHREFYCTWIGAVNGRPKVIVVLTLCDGYFCNISIFCINFSKNARYSVLINRKNLQVVNIPEYGALFTFEKFVHHIPIIFVSLAYHFSRLLESFVQKSSDDSGVTHIALLSSAYMHFLLRLSI